MTVKEINEARKKFKTQIEENNMKMKKNKHIKSQSTISKNKTNINLKNIHNFEDSKINIIDDLNLNIKMNVKTNRIPFRKNDITFNKNLSKLGNKKEINSHKNFKFSLEYSTFQKKDKVNKSIRIDNRVKKMLKPLKNKG